MHLYIISIPINFYQNRFINERAREYMAKFKDVRADGVGFVRYLNQTQIPKICEDKNSSP